jgi:hypothetical protein
MEFPKERHKVARFALFLNLLGGVLLFYSIQITSSKISIVTGLDGSTSMCWQDQSFITAFPNHTFTVAGKCPDSASKQPTAVISTEHPNFITLGFLCLFVGFSIQYILERPEPKLPRPERRRQYMLEFKKAKKAK